MNLFRRPLPYLLISISILLLSSCSKKRPQVTRAYYYWRTSDASFQERHFLKQHSIRKLYTRILDVDWNDIQGAIPVASYGAESLNYDFNVYDSFPVRIVPVVFITNKTMERIDTFDIPLLAKRLVRRCLPAYDNEDKRYEARNTYTYLDERFNVNEIQFDCDWTTATAASYFRLLKEIKSLLPSDTIKISATVRLHQYKYFSKTGVPPVDRGMLMAYNISNPGKYGESNSIFDIDKAKEYFTSSKKYPLPLDIALPAWSWCLIYRDKEFYQIENGLDESDLKALSFLQSKGNHFYSVTKDTVYRELFLRPGDEIKAEGIDEKTLQEVAALAQKAVNTDQFTVSLFELSEKETQHYSHETIDKVYSSFY